MLQEQSAPAIHVQIEQNSAQDLYNKRKEVNREIREITKSISDACEDQDAYREASVKMREGKLERETIKMQIKEKNKRSVERLLSLKLELAGIESTMGAVVASNLKKGIDTEVIDMRNGNRKKVHAHVRASFKGVQQALPMA